MKCAKCGYVSFDHLSECKKCQTSMAAVRQGFGFSAARPAAPSLLGSLLRDHQPPAQQKTSGAEVEAYIPFSSQEQISGALGEGFGTESADATLGAERPGDPQEDFSLLDLSDEELDLLIEKDTFGNGKKEKTPSRGIEDEALYSAETTPSPPRIAMASAADASPAGDEFISFDGFLEMEDETEALPMLDLEKDSNEESGRREDAAGAPVEFNPALEASAQPEGSAENDFVIDLSESELEALLKRLEGSSKGKA